MKSKRVLDLIAKRVLLVGMLWVLVACRGMSPVERPEGQAADAPVAPTIAGSIPSSASPAGAPTAPVTQSAGLTGLIFAASDVAGQPDQPLPDQMVLAVPAAQADAILGPGAQQLGNQQLRFLKANLPQQGPAIIVTLSDAAGNYTLLLDPGEYILCVADSENAPPSFPAITRGCGLAHVAPGGLRRVDISSGFGEILLVER
jgi:hypothetical protein